MRADWASWSILSRLAPEPGSKPQDHHAAFVWQDGKMTQLPGSDLGRPETYAGAINDRGDIVGTSCYGAGDCAGHILLWTYVR